MKLLAFLVATVVSSVVLAQDFGAAPIARPASDGATFVTFISGHAAPATGTVTQWQFYANNPGFVSLQMWRPGGGGYTLLGRHDLNVTRTGLNVFTPGTSGIAVQAGDVLGFRYDAHAGGIIASSFEVSNWRWTPWPATWTDVPVGGFLADSSLPSIGPQREYSLMATVTPVPEPASLISIGLGAALLAKRGRARRSVGRDA